MKTILITGATGLVGGHLLWHLLQGEVKIKVLLRKESQKRNLDFIFNFYKDSLAPYANKIVWVEGDITDYFSIEDALLGVDEIYHCAGLVSFHEKDYKRLMQVNVEGTANMVNAALEAGVKAFCHVSSVAVFPNHDNVPCIDESVGWKASSQNSAYAISKYGAEREVWRASEEGLNVCIVNPTVILGPSLDTKGSAAIVQRGLKGIRFYPVGGSGFVDVRDVVRAMMFLMAKQRFGKRYVISAENWTYHRLFKQINACFKHEIKLIKIPPLVLRLLPWVAKPFSVFSSKAAALTPQLARSLNNRNVYSSRLMDEFSGLEKNKLEGTIQDVALFYRNHQN